MSTLRHFSWFVVLMTAFVGCRQASEPDSQGSSQEQSSAQAGNETESVSEMAEATSESATAKMNSETTTAGESDSGEPPGEMTLPDIPLPPSTDKSQGQETNTPSDAKPGEGGIELPNLDSEQQQSNSKIDSASRLQLASWQAIQQRATSSGKVTVLDLWSLSCEPCVRELPGLVQLHRSLEDQLVCLAVNIDYDGRKTRPPESYAQAADDFLARIGADFQNYLCNTPREDVLNELELVSIPAVLVFDADGNLIKRFVHAGDMLNFTYESHVTPWLKTQALSSTASL